MRFYLIVIRPITRNNLLENNLVADRGVTRLSAYAKKIIQRPRPLHKKLPLHRLKTLESRQECENDSTHVLLIENWNDKFHYQPQLFIHPLTGTFLN